MKVYFLSSSTAPAEYEPLYRQVIDIVSRHGANVVTDVFSARNTTSPYFSRVKAHIRGCDAVIAEVSVYTQSMGYEIANALEQEKPVYCFRNPQSESPGKKPLPKNSLITIVPYTPKNLEEQVSHVLQLIAQGTVEKFTFALSPKQKKYLDWIEKNNEQTRSEYLKKLIDRDLKNNHSYSSRV